MKIYVIDASVILRTLSDKGGPADKFFRKLLTHQKKKRVHLYSIPYLLLEIANGLRFTLKESKFAEESLKECINLPIKYFPLTNSHIDKALQLSYQYKTTVYDSLYHVVAAFLDGIFLTCDAEYVSKAKGYGNIKLLR